MKRIQLHRVSGILATAAMGVALVGCQSASNNSMSSAPQHAVYTFNQPYDSDSESARSSPGPASPTDVIALSQPATETMRWLSVDSNNFQHAQRIPERFTINGEGFLPNLSWSQIPDGTKSFAIVVEDPEALSPRPFVHLIMFNVPANHTSINRHDVLEVQHQETDAVIGTNSKGTQGYAPLAPPVGDSAHEYHFQVFALDTLLNLQSDAQKKDLLNAMNGHVLAKGETIGFYQHP